MAAPSSDRAAIRQTIRALKAAGYTLDSVWAGYTLDSVWDGEEDVKVSTEAEAIEAITAVDEASLYVKAPESEATSFVFFVLGNDPEEVINDHGVSLSPVLDPLTESWGDY